VPALTRWDAATTDGSSGTPDARQEGRPIDLIAEQLRVIPTDGQVDTAEQPVELTENCRQPRGTAVGTSMARPNERTDDRDPTGTLSLVNTALDRMGSETMATPDSRVAHEREQSHPFGSPARPPSTRTPPSGSADTPHRPAAARPNRSVRPIRRNVTRW
jgi:hypothetical protein